MSEAHLKIPNYRSIAQICGVGKSTVGRVFQGSGYVSEEVRRRVIAAAAELGYRPDPALGALSRRRWPKGAQPKTATLGYIFHRATRSPSETIPEFQGLRQRATELGYVVDAFSISEYPSAASLSRVMDARGIRGVIVQAVRDNIAMDLDWSSFHTVFMGPENDIASVHNVQADFRSALHLGVQACVDRGYRRIGIALMKFDASGTDVPFTAQALFERNRLASEIGPQPALFHYVPHDSHSGPFFRWFSEERPEAIVSTNIQPYYWLVDAAHYDRRKRAGQIPGDVAFVCVRTASDCPEIAHVDLREREQGRQAVDLVHQQLQHGSIGKPAVPLRLLIPPVFVAGTTLPTKRTGSKH
jgi:LacI family transcriptional regulator